MQQQKQRTCALVISTVCRSISLPEPSWVWTPEPARSFSYIPFKRCVSFCLAANRRFQSSLTSSTTHPNPSASWKPAANSLPYTKSFLGTQPLITQVPPNPPVVSVLMGSYGISQRPTLAPALEAIRDARTPPEPPPKR